MDLWASRMPTRCYYHSCWAWSSIFKVLKVISLQYLYNISKEEVRKGVHFLHAHENQSFYKLGLLFLMKVTRYVESTQNRKLVIFLQRVLQLFLCSIVMQNIQIFYGGPSWCFSIEAVNHICPSNKPKKACIRPCDANNFTQSLTRKYNHTAAESLYRLCDEK